MEIDHLKFATEDQMEMMMMTTTMMQQIDKLPEFYHNDVVELPPSELSGASATHLIENPHDQLGPSPPFMNLLQATGSTPVHVTPPPPPGFLSCGPGSENSYPTLTPSQKKNSMAAMREMIFRIAAMQPIHIDPESVKPPKRRNVKISKDPQSVAARHRRERISERIRILQRLVPGGTKMDTASMLDEAIHYVKFLKSQVQSLERLAAANANANARPTSGSFVQWDLQQFGDAN